MPKSYDETEDDFLVRMKNSKAFRRLITEMLSMRRVSLKVFLSVVITAIAGTLYPLTLGFSINGIIQRNYSSFEFFAGIFLVLFLITFASNRIRTVESTRLAQSEIKSLRERAFGNLQRVPVSFFGKVKTGYLISRITNDAENLSEFLTFLLPAVISGISTVILSISIMFFLDWTLALYALIVIPVLVGFTFILQPRVMRNYLATRKTIAAITGSMSENIGAFRATKAYGVENYTEKRFSSLNTNNYKANMKAAFLSSIYGSAIRMIEAAGIAIVILAGALELSAGLISVGILVAFILYVQNFFEPVTQLSQLYTSYQSAMVGIARIYAIIDSDDEIYNLKTQSPDHFKNSIQFRDVSFKYDTDYALKNINITIAKGEKIGIVGHTGAGKTTFSNLLLGFYEPTEGDIIVDGDNLRELNLVRYRNLIAPVLQDIFIFRGSVYENIQFSKPEISKDETSRLAKEYGLDAIFDSLPEGIDTQVGELGSNLSEGQKQAVSLMRAYVRNPEILLMDEPTSQIDPFSEAVIMKSLRLYVRDKTLVLITHRFSLISLVDRITVIHGGEIVEEGAFEELSASDGIFNSLYRIYSGTGDPEL